MTYQSTRAALAALVAIGVGPTAVFGWSPQAANCACGGMSRFEPGSGDPAMCEVDSYGITYFTAIEGYCSDGASCPGEDVGCLVDVEASVEMDPFGCGLKVCAKQRSSGPSGPVDTPLEGWPYCDTEITEFNIGSPTIIDVPDYENACGGSPEYMANVYCFDSSFDPTAPTWGCFVVSCADCSSSQAGSGSTGGH